MTEERFREDELNRLWNALIDGRAIDGPVDLDPAQAETWRRIHGMTLAPVPAAVRARLDGDMSARLTAPANETGALDPNTVQVLVHGPDGHRNPWTPVPAPEPLAPRPVPARFRWAVAQAGTALLVLVALGLAVLVAAPSHLDRLEALDIRQVFAPETMTTGVTVEETLFAATLPAEALPQADRVSGTLSHFTIEPGVASVREPALAGCCPGIRVDHVLEGEFVVRPEGPAHVLRRGGDLSPQSVAPGTEVALLAGDTLVSRYEDSFATENPGSNPVRLLDWVLVDGFVTPNHGNPSGWDYHFDGHSQHDLTLPEQPASLRLDQVVLQPGARLDPELGVTALFGITLADDEPLRWPAPNVVENANDWPVTVHVLTLATAGDVEP